MLRFAAAAVVCAALSAAQTRDLGECGSKVLSRATQYFDILTRAPLRPVLPAAAAQAAAELRASGLLLTEKPPGPQLRIGKKFFAVDNPKSWTHYEAAERRAWMDIVEFENTDTIRTMLERATQWHYGRRTGDFFAFVTFQREPGEDVVAAGLRRDRYLFNFGLALPFDIGYDGQNPTSTAEQLEQISGKIDTLAAAIGSFTRLAINPEYKTWFPPVVPAESDLRAMRLAGFARLWAEVKFNFVFLSKRPNVDWDAMLNLYMPRIAAARDDAEYVRILQEAVALLNDGHTWVQPLRRDDLPPVAVEPVEGRPIVVAAAPSTGLTPGVELIEVDGMPVREKLARDVYPYVASSTRQDLELRGLRHVFRGETGTAVDTVFAGLDGKRIRAQLVRGGGTLPEKPATEFRELPDNIAYLAINTFMSDAGAKTIDTNLNRILRARALIVDVRQNGGGNSGYGHAVISRLIDRTLTPERVARYRTRLYKPAFRAWGRPEEWHEGDHGKIEPFGSKQFLGPVAVLIGPKTGSAAEDFIVALAASKRATLIGTPSAGSTGQPLMFQIYGASIGICTKWNTFPDGTEFVGVGVQPDIRVEPTRRDIAEGKDPVLDAAVRHLNERVAR